jgi:predicted MFS family arabinose efflux permease
MAGTAAMVLAWAPVWWVALPACLVAGFGFFMFHNTMQTNATQMAPQARGTAVSSFAACLFLGQSVGVVLAASLAGPLGSAAVITLAGAVMVGAGLFFAHQLQHRERLLGG